VAEQPPCKRQVVCSIQTGGTRLGLNAAQGDTVIPKNAGVTAGWVLAALLLAAAAAVAAPGSTSPSAKELVEAVSRGECDKAIRLANQDAQSDDAQANFLVGRMVDEGVCVNTDGPIATAYFHRAASLGSSDAELEYGVQVGLGEGVEQSYERAGELCQKGGLKSPASQSSLYSLGYVCTVSGLASRLLRESLPPHPFVHNSGVTRVSFNPATGVMHIRATPRVTRTEDTTTGSYLSKPLFDADRAIATAWKQALGTVPKPDAGRLAQRDVELTLDLEMPIEGQLGRQRSGESQTGPKAALFMPGEVHPTTGPH
jgi:TPR repeat protein